MVSGNNQTVIIGATGINAGLNLFNGTSGQSGLASLDVNSLGTGVSGPTGGELVASGSSQSYTATLNTGTLGRRSRHSRSMVAMTIRCREHHFQRTFRPA